MKSNLPPATWEPLFYYFGIIICAYILWSYYHETAWDDYHEKQKLVYENNDLFIRLHNAELKEKVKDPIKRRKSHA